MIEIKNVYKKYDREVLKNINLTLGNKGLICLVGESGSGKSTILNIIAGIETPDSGLVKYNGKDISHIDKTYYNNKIISYIFQNYNLIDKYTVKDNILLPIKIRKKKEKENLQDILGALKIKYLEKRKVNKLSGGEAQRVAIARSLIQDAKIIIADEPTGALDSSNSLRIMSILKRISQDKLVIIVTHSVRLAKKFADQIITIKDGEISNYENNITPINEEIPKEKFKLKLKDKIRYALMNIKSKLLRNILTSIAFMIGLFSLGLVMSISTGFNKELNNLNKSTFYNYPLVLNKHYEDINVSSTTKDHNGIKVKKSNILTNNIDENLINKIENIDKKYTKGISYYKKIDNEFNLISRVNPGNNFFEIIEGKMPNNKNEALLLMDEENSINEDIYKYLNVENKGIINNKFTVDNKEITISGIAKSQNEYFSTQSAIIYDSALFQTEITNIEIYPSSIENKEKIKEILKEYHLQDDAMQVVEVISNLSDGITTILIIFSLISLIVSIIMIWVISYISVLERTKDIGIYKCLGYRNKDIRNLFVLENILIGLISYIISIISIYTVGKIINNYIYNYIGLNNIVNINIKTSIILLLISIIFCYIASFIPAQIGSRKKVVDILKQ